MNTEVWKNVLEYEGIYMVSNKGRVKSLIAWNGHEYISKERILKPFIKTPFKGSNYKYHCIKLSKFKEKKDIRLHRLIAQTFIPNPHNKAEVNHKDFNPLNNSVENLEWCTGQENKNWNVKHRIRKSLTLDEEREIAELYYSDMPISEILKKYNTTYIVLYSTLKELGCETNKQKRGKYNISLESLYQDLAEGNASNKELAYKYNCSTMLIGTRRYQFKKEGLLRTAQF